MKNIIKDTPDEIDLEVPTTSEPTPEVPTTSEPTFSKEEVENLITKKIAEYEIINKTTDPIKPKEKKLWINDF